jgi:MFS transporter, UMF1 family
VSYGTAVWLLDGNQRPAMLVLGVYFILGLVLLARVDVGRGRQRSLSPSGPVIGEGPASDLELG